MDNSELHYITYDPEAILQRMYETYIESGGSGIYPGDEKSILLQGVLQMFVQAFAGMDNAMRMATLRYAVGEYLDLIGETRNCERIPAEAAQVEIQLVFDAEAEAGTVIAAGTAFTADGRLLWLTEEDITLAGGAQTVTAQATCSEAGSAGNALTAGTVLQPLTDIAGLTWAQTTGNATGGQEAEDDDDYRERIRIQGTANTTTGPANQYEYLALSVNTNIMDAKAVNGGAGVVNVYLILADESESAADIAAVTAALDATDSRPLTDEVHVSLATAVNYTLNVQYTVDSNVTVADLQAAAEAYQSWQDQKIGRAFDPDKLKAMLYSAGATRVVFGSGSAFDGGAVEWNAIGSDERCKGTITLEAMSE